MLKNYKYPKINTISAETLASLMVDSNKSLVIVDCRFEYEYNGGHINGAVNLNTKEQMENHFFKNKENIESLMFSKCIIIFHCEFSLFRGPTMYNLMRAIDRDIHTYFYPDIFYTEIYLLEGGFKKFFSLHP